MVDDMNKKNMKILHITRGYGRLLPEENPGAIESVIINISRCLASNGHESIIADRRSNKSSAQYIDGIKIVRFDSGNIRIKGNRLFDLISSELDFINFAFKVRKFVKQHPEYDIIHVHSTMVGLCIAMLNKDAKKMIYTSHNSMWSLSEDSTNMLENCLRYLDVCLMKRVGKVLALGQEMKSRYILKGILPGKIFIVHNGVNTNFFNPGNSDKNVGHLNVDNNKFNILFVGRLDKIKGINYLIRTMDIIVNEYGYNNIQCLIVGPDKIVSVDSNEDINSIINYIGSKNLTNNIRFLGELSIEDLKRIYNICDVFVLPSIAEVAPLTILEAMAFGKPIVCTNIGAVSEYVIDKFNGFLINPKNEMQLTEKILYIFNNPDIKKTMGDNSLQLAKKFDWHNVCDNIEYIYRLTA